VHVSIRFGEFGCRDRHGELLSGVDIQVWSDRANHPKLPARSQEFPWQGCRFSVCVSEQVERRTNSQVDRARATHGKPDLPVSAEGNPLGTSFHLTVPRKTKVPSAVLAELRAAAFLNVQCSSDPVVTFPANAANITDPPSPFHFLDSASSSLPPRIIKSWFSPLSPAAFFPLLFSLSFCHCTFSTFTSKFRSCQDSHIDIDPTHHSPTDPLSDPR